MKCRFMIHTVAWFLCDSSASWSYFLSYLYIYLQDAEQLTVEEFIAKVGKVLREADFPTKSEIIATLSELFTYHTMPRDAVRDAVYAVLSGSDDSLTPDYTCMDDEQFVQAALPLLFMISDHDKDLLVELMFAYVEGSEAMRYISSTLHGLN